MFVESFVCKINLIKHKIFFARHQNKNNSQIQNKINKDFMTAQKDFVYKKTHSTRVHNAL